MSAAYYKAVRRLSGRCESRAVSRGPTAVLAPTAR